MSPDDDRLPHEEQDPRNEELAAFQSALLLLLEQDLSETELRLRLEHDPAFECFRAEVRAIDRRALGIAARIVKKWARRPATP